jgi:hypothetical protein
MFSDIDVRLRTSKHLSETNLGSDLEMEILVLDTFDSAVKSFALDTFDIAG